MAKKKQLEVVVERLPPLDAHDKQKWVRLVAYVPGSPKATWKTCTINVNELLADKDGKKMAARVEKLKADVREYFPKEDAQESISTALAALGVKET